MVALLTVIFSNVLSFICSFQRYGYVTYTSVNFVEKIYIYTIPPEIAKFLFVRYNFQRDQKSLYEINVF